MPNVAQIVRRALGELARELPGVPTVLIACDAPRAPLGLRMEGRFGWTALPDTGVPAVVEGDHPPARG